MLIVFPLSSMRAGTRSVFLSIVSSVPRVGKTLVKYLLNE